MDADDIRRQLREHGSRRRQALATAQAELAAAKALVPDAIAAGLTKIEVARLAGISRPTLDELLKRA